VRGAPLQCRRPSHHRRRDMLQSHGSTHPGQLCSSCPHDYL